LTPPVEAASLVGVWKLMSIRLHDLDTGRVGRNWGQSPRGYLHYTAGGRMIVLITRADRPALAGGGYEAAEPSVEEKARAYDTLDSYCGTYEVSAAGVLHHVDIASNERRVGADQMRFASLDKGLLTLETPEMAFARAPRAKLRLVWEKIET
jgi:hypothetical protein